MTRPVDWQQREAGRDPSRSFIVQAPAGSGKTELLTQRMLGLLAQVEQPEEVLAITFTRKAAAEMNHRLLKELQQAAEEPGTEGLEAHKQVSRKLAVGVLNNDRNRDWNLLQQPSRLRIRTIDSLCSDLARQLPILSGLGGGQQITEKPEELYHLAAVRTMAAIEDDSDELQADVTRILDRYDNQYDRLVELLTNMLASREQWKKHLFGNERLDRVSLESALCFLVENELETALERLPADLLSALPLMLEYALANNPQDQAELAALIEDCGGYGFDRLELAARSDALPHWKTLIRRLLTADGKKWRSAVDAKAGFPPPSGAKGEERAIREYWKQRFRELMDGLRENDSLHEQLNIIRTLPRPAYEDEAWESLESLIRIMARTATEWEIVMAESGSADFSEVAQRAYLALGDDMAPSDLALRLDYRIRHLLVDEFQDTSHSQVDLLNRLTAGWTEGDGRTLFLVGDPMQSIYRFRKAEVSLFIEAFEGRLFDHIRLQALTLEVNFRSTEPIVNWVNRVFPFVLPKENDPVDGAVRYSPSQAAPGADGKGQVDITLLPLRDDEVEAKQIVDIIRKHGPEDQVAILVRSRSHALTTLALLDQLKLDESRLRYRAVDFNPLAETVIVRDLVSLTLALLQPADRLAWFSVLRAPFVGLDLSDLDALAGGEDILIINTIDAFLSGNPVPSLSAEGQRRLQRIGPVLLETSCMSGRQSTRSLVESAWIQLGGPACVDNASELDDAATYFDLLDALENEHLPIDRDSLDQRLENLFAEPDADASDKLQVMTIYAAKGLQFDSVILPGLNRDTGKDKPSLLHWFELAGEDQIVMSPMRNVEEKGQKHGGDLIQFISGVEKRRQALENGRLLYVATTRAVHSLYLFGAVKPGKDGDIKPSAAALLGRLWPAIKAEQEPRIQALAEQALENEPEEDVEPLLLPQLFRRLPQDWKLPASPSPVQRAQAGHTESRDFIEFRWAGEDARLTGNLVHRLLQLIAEQGIETWQPGGGMAARRTWCLNQLAAEGVLGIKAEAIIKRASQAIENCLDSTDGRWILDQHEASACEMAVTAIIEDQPVNLVLDRTFVDDGIRWIIDYKTSAHGGGDLEGFLQNEADRYRDQLTRYRQAIAIRETRPVKTALYFPLLDRLVEVSEGH